MPAQSSLDPTLAIPLGIVGVPGSIVNVPLSITDSAVGVTGFNVTISYSTAALDLPDGLNAGGITLGSMFASEGGWTLDTFVDESGPTGSVTLSFYRIGDSTSTAGQVANLAFLLKNTVTDGTTIPLDVSGTEVDPPFSYSFVDGSIVAEVSTTAGRHIFYNQSVWDGNSAAINPVNDNAAIATDKTPYLPGSGLATYSNITSFSRGITGIMVDLSTGVSHAGISASDFIFKVGNDNSPASWTGAPAPTAISVVPGGGTGGSDRVIITWAVGSISNKWLEVQVLANANTGLVSPDVFFWGNKIGDSGTGTPATKFVTDSTDSAQVFATIGAGKPITDLRDYNRDGQVNSTDAAIVFANIGNIVRLNIGGAGPFAPEAEPAVASEDGSYSTVASALAAVALNGAALPSSAPGQMLNLGGGSVTLSPSASQSELLGDPARVRATATATAHDLSLDDDLLDFLLEDLAIAGGKKSR
jgi:hypothetical protein